MEVSTATTEASPHGEIIKTLAIFHQTDHQVLLDLRNISARSVAEVLFHDPDWPGLYIYVTDTMRALRIIKD